MTERVAFGWPYGLLSVAAGRTYTAALVQRAAGCLVVESRDPRDSSPNWMPHDQLSATPL